MEHKVRCKVSLFFERRSEHTVSTTLCMQSRRSERDWLLQIVLSQTVWGCDQGSVLRLNAAGTEVCAADLKLRKEVYGSALYLQHDRGDGEPVVAVAGLNRDGGSDKNT